MDRLPPTTSGPTPDARYTHSAPGDDALEELRAAWDAVTAARDRLFELLARDGDPYETWRKAMGDEMLAHVAFVEVAKDVANRAYGRVSLMGRPEGEQAPKRVSAEGSPLSLMGRPEGEPTPKRVGAEGVPATAVHDAELINPRRRKTSRR